MATPESFVLGPLAFGEKLRQEEQGREVRACSQTSQGAKQNTNTTCRSSKTKDLLDEGIKGTTKHKNERSCCRQHSSNGIMEFGIAIAGIAHENVRK
jgi:hypothetical protein